jgi:hypothetical protein
MPELLAQVLLETLTDAFKGAQADLHGRQKLLELNVPRSRAAGSRPDLVRALRRDLIGQGILEETGYPELRVLRLRPRGVILARDVLCHGTVEARAVEATPPRRFGVRRAHEQPVHPPKRRLREQEQLGAGLSKDVRRTHETAPSFLVARRLQDPTMRLPRWVTQFARQFADEDRHHLLAPR